MDQGRVCKERTEEEGDQVGGGGLERGKIGGREVKVDI